jgi:sugar/nucleoside kinase (ribokinase family)
MTTDKPLTDEELDAIAAVIEQAQRLGAEVSMRPDQVARLVAEVRESRKTILAATVVVKATTDMIRAANDHAERNP